VELPLGGLGGGLGGWASCRGGVAGCGGGAGGCLSGVASGASAARLLQEQPIAAATTPAAQATRAALGRRAAPRCRLINRFLSYNRRVFSLSRGLYQNYLAPSHGFAFFAQ